MKKLTLWVRETPPSTQFPDGVPAELVEAEYSDDEIAFMERRRRGLDGPDAEIAREAANQMAVVHELKALLGARMLTVEEAVEHGYQEPDTEPEHVQTTFVAPDGAESTFRVPPKARQALGISEPDAKAARP